MEQNRQANLLSFLPESSILDMVNMTQVSCNLVVRVHKHYVHKSQGPFTVTYGFNKCTETCWLSVKWGKFMTTAIICNIMF